MKRKASDLFCRFSCILHVKGPTLKDPGDLRSLHSDRIAEWYMKSWPIAFLCLLKLFIPHQAVTVGCQRGYSYSYGVFKVWSSEEQTLPRMHERGKSSDRPV